MLETGPVPVEFVVGGMLIAYWVRFWVQKAREGWALPVCISMIGAPIALAIAVLR